MSIRGGRRLQVAAACAAIAAYAVLSHYCNSVAGAREMGAGLALAPMIVIAAVLAWRSTPPPVAALLIAGVAGLLYALWPALIQHYSLLSLVQESSIYGLLGFTFGRSLMGRRVALCTQLADKMHGPLTAQELRYTRRVTAAWAAFFFTVASASIMLYAWTPLRIWSIYVNFCVLPLVGAMFIAEHLVRRRFLPQVKRAGVLATLRVYLATPQ